MLHRLEQSYGVCGSAHDWFAAFLHGRTQSVRCGSTRSASRSLLYGVSQGSVLEPILFLLYTADLIRLVESHDLSPHLYADDTQVYGFCRPGDTNDLQERMAACISDIAIWMQSNRLQLNTAKTEVIWCTSGLRQHQIPATAQMVGNDAVMPVKSVRDLGIYVDSDLSMRTHISKTVSGCFAMLRQIRSIRRSVTKPVFLSLIVSLVLLVRLWLQDSRRTSEQSVVSTASSPTCCCTAHLPCKKV